MDSRQPARFYRNQRERSDGADFVRPRSGADRAVAAIVEHAVENAVSADR